MSTFLHDVVEPGDELEVRGPLGGWFVWDGDAPGAPRRRRLRRRAADGDAAPGPPHRDGPISSAWSSRCAAPTTCCYAAELPGPETTIVYTRVAAAVDGTAAVAASPAPTSRRRSTRRRTAYVCGSAGFCNAAGDLLVELGVPVEQIRVERFGPTG